MIRKWVSISFLKSSTQLKSALSGLYPNLDYDLIIKSLSHVSELLDIGQFCHSGQLEDCKDIVVQTNGGLSRVVQVGLSVQLACKELGQNESDRERIPLCLNSPALR